MKLLIILMVFIGYSCNSPKQFIKPFPKPSEFESTITISYGDARFHDCEELVDITLGMTVVLITTEQEPHIQKTITTHNKKINYESS